MESASEPFSLNELYLAQMGDRDAFCDHMMSTDMLMSGFQSVLFSSKTSCIMLFHEAFFDGHGGMLFFLFCF